MYKLAVIAVIVLKACYDPQAPEFAHVHLSESAYATEFDRVVEAWERTPGLHNVPSRCHDFYVSELPTEDFYYWAWDARSVGYVRGWAVVILDSLGPQYKAHVFRHEAAHMLTWCVGIGHGSGAGEALDAYNRDHVNLRVWGPEGILAELDAEDEFANDLNQ